MSQGLIRFEQFKEVGARIGENAQNDYLLGQLVGGPDESYLKLKAILAERDSAASLELLRIMEEKEVEVYGHKLSFPPAQG